MSKDAVFFYNINFVHNLFASRFILHPINVNILQLLLNILPDDKLFDILCAVGLTKREGIWRRQKKEERAPEQINGEKTS